MNMKSSGITAKSQADLVAAEAPPVNVVKSEKINTLPGLANIFELGSEERKAMFVAALRSRRGITRFGFRLGEYDSAKTKKELVQLAGLSELHNRSYEEIAATLLAATQTRDDFIGLEYTIDEDRNGAVVNKLQVEFGVKINPANCQPDEEGNRKDTKFGPFFELEYTT